MTRTRTNRRPIVFIYPVYHKKSGQRSCDPALASQRVGLAGGKWTKAGSSHEASERHHLRRSFSCDEPIPSSDDCASISDRVPIQHDLKRNSFRSLFRKKGAWLLVVCQQNPPSLKRTRPIWSIVVALEPCVKTRIPGEGSEKGPGQPHPGPCPYSQHACMGCETLLRPPPSWRSRRSCAQ